MYADEDFEPLTSGRRFSSDIDKYVQLSLVDLSSTVWSAVTSLLEHGLGLEGSRQSAPTWLCSHR